MSAEEYEDEEDEAFFQRRTSTLMRLTAILSEISNKDREAILIAACKLAGIDAFSHRMPAIPTAFEWNNAVGLEHIGQKPVRNPDARCECFLTKDDELSVIADKMGPLHHRECPLYSSIAE